MAPCNIKIQCNTTLDTSIEPYSNN